MKKYINIFAVLAMALFVGSCEDELEQEFEPVQIVSGEEIIFGACYRPVSVDKAPADRITRTEYGETNADNKWIEINWIPEEDRMLIASPQSAGAAMGVAEYKVKASEDSEIDGGASVVTELVRTGAAGLQWSNATEYDFYAVYPSVNQLKESVADGAESCSLSKDGLLSGYLPTEQFWTEVKSTNNRYIFLPNMDYAYMVAKTNYTINKVDEEGVAFMGEPINLDFESLVTALQFEIKAGDLNLNNSTEDNHISIISVALFSQSGQQLAGDFVYDIKKNGTKGTVSKGNTTNSQVIQKFEGLNITLSNESTSALDLTFFLLPSVENYASGDLRLQIMYEVNGTPQIKTATIGTQIPARVKRYFSNVKLPAISGEVDASKWFQALNPNVLVSQVSIPVAANTFANSSYGVTDTYRKQQTLKIDSMWNFGVRGFEMVNTSDGEAITEKAGTLGNMVASEAKQGSAGTFIDYVKLLRSKQLASFTYDEGVMVSGDPLILICTYSATNDGYSPARYIQNLFASLDELIGSSYKDDNGVTTNLQITENTFVQLTSNSTVKDVMGKICVIVRPGDDERWAVQGTGENEAQWDPYALYGNNAPSISDNSNSRYGLTKALPSLITSGWWNKILLISDWGMDSWDSWHRRFGKEYFYYYATTATNLDKLVAGKRTHVSQYKYEDQLLGGAAPGDAPTERKYYYPHDLSNGNENTAYVQDMVRVVETAWNKELTLKYGEKEYSWSRLEQKTGTAKVSWVASLSEKKNAIRGLFELAVNTKGNTTTKDIYINNLSGYFQTEDYTLITEKKAGIFSTVEEGGLVSYFPVYDAKNFKNSAKGGDYKKCADELTKYVYGILSGDPKLSGEETTLAEGPWGLVMMDYIGTATKSKELVNLIVKNNFAGFELAEKQDENKAKTAKVPFSDEEISPELDVLVNWD